MKKHTLLLACAMRILLNLIALPDRGLIGARSCVEYIVGDCGISVTRHVGPLIIPRTIH